MVESELNRIEKALKGSKLDRFLYNPAGYLKLIFVKYFLGSFTRHGILSTIHTIFGFDYRVRLPSSAEFLVFKCKSELSDIRLIRYLQRQLRPNDTFVDIGAKYGFYSLLAAKKINHFGKIIAIEPTLDSFELLKLNTKDYPQIIPHHFLASDDRLEYPFYEFPTRYTEYNTIQLDPFLSASSWYAFNRPVPRKMKGIVLDEFLAENHWIPNIIKIDAENADFKIVSGLIKTVINHHPDCILRLWDKHRDNANQRAAIDLLVSYQYDIFGINENGSLDQLSIPDLDQYPYEDVILKFSQPQRQA